MADKIQGRYCALTELADLNRDAVELAAKIAQNFEALI